MSLFRAGHKGMAAVCVAVCLAGYVFAQEPTPAKPAPPTSATAPAPAAPAARADQPDNAKSDESAPSTEPSPAPAAVEGKLDAEKIMAAQKAGYTIRNEDGQTLLCRRELQTGSRVRYRTSCLTAREWDQLHSDTQQSLRVIERPRPALNGR